MELPQIVTREQWQQAHEALLAKEKQATRERDALAAERRRQPMVRVRQPTTSSRDPTGSCAFPTSSRVARS